MKDRLRRAQTVNAEIADWIQERRRVEDQYAQALTKLARKNIPQDLQDLGVFQTAWTKLVKSTQDLAQAHTTFSHSLEKDVERRLRDFVNTNKEWSEFRKVEPSLSKIAEEVDLAEKKSDKLKKRGTKAQAQKVADAASGVEKAMNEWESQAPFVFEQLQQVDEVRIGNLRDALTQYHTLEADCAQKAMQYAQDSLTTLLDVNPNDEIKAFASRTTNGKARIERTRSRTGTAHSNTPGMQSSNPSFVMDHDGASVQSSGSGGAHSEPRLHSLPERSDTSTSLKHGFNLKRLGTVIRGRANRNSQMPYLRASSPDKRAVSSERLGTPKGPSAHHGFNSVNNSPRTPSRGGESITRRDSNPSMPPLIPVKVGEEPMQNGDASRKGSTASNVPASPSIGNDAPHPPSTAVSMASTTATEPQKDAEGYTIPPPVNNDVVSLAMNGDEEQAQPQFKVEIRNDVIHEEEEDADVAFAKVANSLRQQTTGTVSRKSRGRREGKDVRQTVFFSPVEQPGTTGTPSPTLLPAAPVVESGNGILAPPPVFDAAPVIAPPPATISGFEAAGIMPPPPTTNALEPSPIRLQPSPILYPTAPSQELVGTLMGTSSTQASSNADLPSTNEQTPPIAIAPPPTTSTPPPPSIPSGFSPASPPLSPIRFGNRPFTPSDAGSDTPSIRSSHSITSHSPHAPLHHPTPLTPGLSASLIHSLSVTLTHGTPTRALCSAELAFTYNPTTPTSDPTKRLIRLTSLPPLDRLYPNPALLQPTSNKDEYTLTLPPRGPTCALRLQLSLPPQLAPLIITPAWKLESDKASLILSYRLNPACTLPRPVTLKNVVFVTGVEGVRVGGCQSKPVGTFSRERGRLAWKVGEVVLEDETPKKLLARFTTEGVGRVQPVEARWEVEGGWGSVSFGAGEGEGEGGEEKEFGPIGVEVWEEEETEGEKEVDPFADDATEGESVASGPKGEWREVETVRRVVGGKYIAM
ncbi:hypothetical protein BJ508DRAFT_145823 [Ascobolus immersus RN42]|uniref:MHD domain-containing protein n=1 Tax=Ascobolus immersus RN42 TaxID=1160509 RepID=A0A3N4I359_ASCIM|nr:hypothetical protein BJ508DRAFT_145823 [Ascobolus immersus RN42]